MKLTYDPGTDRFLFKGSYQSRHLPRNAGFCWSPVEKVWYTRLRDRASMLCRYADPRARAELGDHADFMPENQRAAVLNCLRELASRCDGAVTQDGEGFNKAGTNVGRELARHDTLTSEQAALGLKLIRLHQHQLPDYMLVSAGAIRRTAVCVG